MLSALRVGFLTSSWMLGGMEVWHRTLWRYADLRRIRPVFLGVQREDAVVREALRDLPAGVEVVVGERASATLAAACDVVVAYGDVDLRPVADSGTPAIYVVHLDGRDPSAISWARRNEPFADCLAAVSEGARMAFSPSGQRRCEVVFNAIDPDRLRPSTRREDIRRQWGISRDKFVLGYLGRIALFQKRLDRVILAAEHLPPSVEIVLMGSGHQERACRTLGDSLPAACRDRIHWLTPGRRNVGDFLTGIDALVSPSDLEGFGLSVAEAWWSGVPVLSTPVGIVREYPDLCRLLPERCAPEELAEICLKEIAATRLREQRVRAARVKAREICSPEVFAMRWAGIIDRTAREKVSRRKLSIEGGLTIMTSGTP